MQFVEIISRVYPNTIKLTLQKILTKKLIYIYIQAYILCRFGEHALNIKLSNITTCYRPI